MNLKTQIMINSLIRLNIPVFLILVFSISLNSCKQKEEIPKDLISKDNFIKIMVDIRMVETTIRQKISRGNNAAESTEYYYNYIFKKYNITPKQFDTSLKYYSSHTEEIKEINMKVVEALTQKESEVKAQKKLKK